MYCSNCGVKLDESMNFCNNCGTKVITSVSNHDNIHLSTTSIKKNTEQYDAFINKFSSITKLITTNLKGFIAWSEISSQKIFLLFVISIFCGSAIGLSSSFKHQMDFQKSYSTKKNSWLSSPVFYEHQAINYYNQRKELQNMTEQYESSKSIYFKNGFNKGFLISFFIIIPTAYYIKLLSKKNHNIICKLKIFLSSIKNKI